MITKENGILFASIRLIQIKSNSLQKISQSFRTFELSCSKVLFKEDLTFRKFISFLLM